MTPASAPAPRSTPLPPADVLVTGGTGQLGRVLVQELRHRGASVRVLSRLPEQPGHPGMDQPGVQFVQGDLTRPETLPAAVEGVRTIVHAAHDPAQPLGDARATRDLLQAALDRPERPRPAFVFVSIVGAAQATGFGYYAAKARSEAMVRQSGLPHLIFRATQFHEFVAGLLGGVAGGLDRLPGGHRLPVLLPQGTLQPVALAEVASALAAHTLAGQRGTLEFTGPEVLTLPDLGQSWLLSQGRPGRVWTLPVAVPHPFLQAVRQGRLTRWPLGEQHGEQTWAQWLAQQQVQTPQAQA